MHLESLVLLNFKSFNQAEFAFSPRLNVIYGRNGVGKTNLLDAIYTLAMTKSNFPIPDQLLIRGAEDFFRIQGLLSKNAAKIKVVIKLQRNKKKVIERDGLVITRALDHIGFMPVVMITPDDLELINAANAERRKLADSTLAQVQHAYLENLVIYNRLLKQRNSLLKSWQESNSFDPVLLDAYDDRMNQPAQMIFEARVTFFHKMQEKLQDYYHILCEGREPVNLVYRSELTENSFKELCKINRAKDRAGCRTHAGIHRDAIECLIHDRDARLYGSQGQKKSLVFAIKLAQLDYMREMLDDQPIMLLDDVFDKLDQYRVDRLLSIILSDTFGQVFITDTQWQRIKILLGEYPAEIRKFEIGEP